MIILCLDTCCGRLSVAIFRDGACTNYSIEETPHKQAELALVMIEKVLKDSRLTYQDIDYLSCTVGPGSFTGIRVGVAAIQGINQVLKKPVLGISTLEVMSYLAQEPKVMTCLDAGRGQFYCAKFNCNRAESEIKLLTPDEALTFGKDYRIIGALGNKELPDAKCLGIASFNRIQANETAALALKPIYVRESDAVEKKKNPT